MRGKRVPAAVARQRREYQDRDTSRRGSILGLIFGPIQIAWIAWTIHEIADTSRLLSITLAIVGSAAAMVSFGMLSFRFYASDGEWHRFRLSTIMISMVPIALYLAFFRLLFTEFYPSNDDWFAWAILIAFGAILVKLSINVYLELANSLVQLALLIASLFHHVTRRQ